MQLYGQYPLSDKYNTPTMEKGKGIFPLRSFKAIIKEMAENHAAVWLTGTYILVLIVILLIDLQQRRIMNMITLPTTAVALLAGLAGGRESFISTLLGAAVGFLFFYLLYWLGRKLYGPGALGFGDVKLAMLLGAMLGLHYIWPTLALGLLLAGLASILLLLFGRASMHTSLPFGVFLSTAGIMILVWTTIRTL
jgi:prepilin signal peptidase PulO-like enzyme (type II secretory pathway)